MSSICENKRIKILDCTLRDGGFALEDSENYDSNLKYFNASDRSGIASCLANSKIDFIEIGAIEISENDKKQFAIYQSIEEISKIIPHTNNTYTAMFRGPDTPIDDIPEWNDSYCEYIRVILRYSELKKSVEFCSELAKKGYKVFLQPMVTLRYTEDDIDYLIESANEMEAYALYFVDSYGYMNADDTCRLFRRYDDTLDKKIHIGFHSHNNMNLAFSNVLEFLNCKSERTIIADSTCLGMGQGAGNLQTEILTHHINENYNGNYDYFSVLDACEIIEQYSESPLWGYSLHFLLPAVNKTAYKFAVALRKKYNLHYRDIHHILSNIPEDLRHRYTPENTVKLLKMFDYTDRLD